MPNKNLSNCALAFVLFAATVSFAPSLWGQAAVTPSPPTPGVLPAALSAPRALPEAETNGITSYVGSVRVARVQTHHPRRNWLLLSVASSGAAAFDAYSTRRAISNGAVERDPTLKPFANSNGLYAAIQISPLVLDFASYKMQHSENHSLHRMWWIPQSAETAIYVAAGFHNLAVAGR